MSSMIALPCPADLALDLRARLSRVHRALSPAPVGRVCGGPLRDLDHALGVGLAALAATTPEPADFDPAEDPVEYGWIGRGRRRLTPGRFAPEHWAELAEDLARVRLGALNLALVLSEDQPRVAGWWARAAEYAREAIGQVEKIRQRCAPPAFLRDA